MKDDKDQEIDSSLPFPLQNEIDERTKIILDEGNILFDRYISNVDKINSKILALFQIFLVLITLEITILGIIIDKGDSISSLDYVLLSLILVIGLLAFLYLFYLIWPKKYNIVDVFENDRFDELCNVGKSDLLSDFLYYTQKSYRANQKSYEIVRMGLISSLIHISLNLFFFVIFLITYLII